MNCWLPASTEPASVCTWTVYICIHHVGLELPRRHSDYCWYVILAQITISRGCLLSQRLLPMRGTRPDKVYQAVEDRATGLIDNWCEDLQCKISGRQLTTLSRMNEFASAGTVINSLSRWQVLSSHECEMLPSRLSVCCHLGTCRDFLRAYWAKKAGDGRAPG